jgi:predicted metalloprotease with PDZ domain
MQEIFERVADTKLGDLFDAWIRAPGEIDYAPTLARAGVKLERLGREGPPGAAPPPRVMLGVRVRSDGSRTMVGFVTRGSAAQRAGIDVGDEILAIAGRRADGTLEATLAGLAPREEVEVMLARDGRILRRMVQLDEARPERMKIVVRPDASPAERGLFTAWLGEPHPTWGAR